MKISIGRDLLLVLWSKNSHFDDAIDVLSSVDLNLKIHDVHLSSNTVTINAQLHKIYRHVAGCCWQPTPVIIYVRVSACGANYMTKRNVRSALTLMANCAIMQVKHITNQTEFNEAILHYPLPSSPLLGTDTNAIGITGWTNTLRAASSAMFDSFERVLIVGVHPYLISSVIRNGAVPVVLDMDIYAITDPFRLDSDVEYKDTPLYLPPTIGKLRHLHDVVFSTMFNHLVYIGGAPGDSLVEFDYCKNWKYKPQLDIYDPKFSSVHKRFRKQLKDKGWEVHSKKFGYSALIGLPARGKRIVIIDDAYTSADEKDAFLFCKLNYYKKLLTYHKRQSNIVTVYLKFQFPADLNVIKVPFLDTIMLQPCINSSTETRLILCTGGYEHPVSRKVYFSNVMVWRNLTLAEQYERSLFCYKASILQGDFFKRYADVALPTLALYCLTNSVNGSSVEVSLKMSVMIRWYNSNDIPLLFSAPNIFVNYDDYTSGEVVCSVDGDELTTKLNNDVYHDRLINPCIYYKDGVCDILPQHLVNLSGVRNHGVMNFTQYVLTHVYYVNDYFIRMILPQTGATSPGPIIKYITANWRILYSHNSRETYELRLTLIRKLTDLDKNLGNINTIGGRDVTFHVIKPFTLTVQDGPLLGTKVSLPANTKVTISGHLLNLVIAMCHGHSMVCMWIRQWLAQRHLTHDMSLKGRLNTALSVYSIYDYNASRDLHDSWHDPIDVKLALVIARHYLQELENDIHCVKAIDTVIRTMFDAISLL